MTEHAFVRVERSERTATVTVNRPEKLNALDAQMIGELEAAFSALSRDDSIGGIILTGAGDKAFVAGADIRELAALSPDETRAASRRGQALFGGIEESPKPVIAAVHGYALGGGCELALACHLRVASENARFGLPETGLGLIPGYGGTVRLARLVGLATALEMILTGEPVDAGRALEMGLVNHVVPREDLLAKARERMDRILANGPLAVGAAIESVYRSQGVAIGHALDLESALFGLLASSADAREGLRAFLEKRPPAFRGE